MFSQRLHLSCSPVHTAHIVSSSVFFIICQILFHRVSAQLLSTLCGLEENEQRELLFVICWATGIVVKGRCTISSKLKPCNLCPVSKTGVQIRKQSIMYVSEKGSNELCWKLGCEPLKM